ncbi:Excalibur calcium-binding domain-containing protein [Lentibacillus persicus]|uniref:Excalibur calcium-binding domain-containing protein n=1 Tax=Lentibacillus persicus TaxID=640948 RepID=A0A1I1VWT8_9BACI|nr:excalibur calcium-binding domain-containing protein [Lentibacillus persicus]SFD87364.1 Excalibur calcium-binding domain-containing protein [Lentibacillus persicus]
MMLVAIGFIAFAAALIYLTYHLIRKIKFKDKILSKKLFYPLLIGGLILMVMGDAFTDGGTTAKLNQEIEKNEELTRQIQSLEETNDSLKSELEELTSNKKAVDDKLESKESELSESESKIDDLNAELEDKTGEIEELQDENASLQANVEDLEATIASAEPASSNTSSASTSSNSTSNTYYENCTEARNAGAAPVYAGDPGYASHLDRDGDGIGCE